MAGIASNLADDLTSMLVEKIFEEASLVSNFEEDLRFICDELQSIKSLLNDAGGATNSRPVRNWLRSLGEFVHDAEHLVEDASQQQNGILSRYRMGRKIRVLKDRIQNIHRRSKYLKYDVKPRSTLDNGDRDLVTYGGRSSGLLMDDSSVGMQKDIDLLVEWLLTDDLQIIAVAGMGGLGKTLLLHLVFNCQKIKESFHHLIWVEVSQHFDDNQLLLHIAWQINLPDDQRRTLGVEELKMNIHRHLQGSRSLLVLDDVWDRRVLQLIGFLVGKDNKVVISTRGKSLVENMPAQRTHEMGYLSEENSWKLFCMHAFPNDDNHSPPQELEEMARAIERKCSRLPLTVKTVAASMASVSPLPNQWESTLSRLDQVSTITDDVLPILRLSFNALPDYLKPCFLFCSAYPEDTRISIEYLVHVWIAEGFVNPGETQNPYELGRHYLRQLVDRCMIEFLPYDGSDDMIRYCKMHDLLHKLALLESQNQTNCLYQTGEGLKTFPVEKCQDLRRISLIKNEITSVNKSIHSPGLRTLLLWKNRHLKSICQQFFSKLRQLRVLDLSQTSISSLPRSIANSTHLRLLNLSKTNIEKLPSCLSALTRLQYLDVSWCKKLRYLHSGIGKHQFMLYLNIEGCTNLVFVPHGVSKLVSLQVLGKVIFRENTTNALHLMELKGLTLLQQLSIVISDSQGLSEGIFGGLTQMRKLFLDNRDDAAPLSLPEDMASMRRLEILHLHNCALPTWISELNNLMVLLLKGDHSPNYQTLKTIPNLRRLILLQNNQCIEFLSEFGRAPSFPKLETLIIQDFSLLRSFPCVEENAMPMLKYFRLQNCSQLEGLPQGMDRLNSLQELKVFGIEACKSDLQKNGRYYELFKQRNIKISCE